MNRCFAEALGTYALVAMGCGAVLADGVSQGAVGIVGVSMTFGLVVAAMICSLGDLSGAHLNPAVTVALAVARRFSWANVGPYVAAQCVGALAAAATLRVLHPAAAGLAPTLPTGTVSQSFLMEVVLTFFLMFVILGVTTPGNPAGPLAPIAIGGTVALEVYVGGPISGASMNPARSLGPAVVGGQTEHLWLYLVAPVLGAALASLATRALRAPVPPSDPSQDSQAP